ncbi:hypothetical protein OIDMADRAFT_19961 [Oidiodendron maius Zn]|uniref:Uncharacterized protein n=1 Tax=Oidiodendron maius (strain Zn) TaxID=913774 RepID=A0A0C3H6U9_OIDMZ|nr:hypothetical protein OIDMADRAFT_19961 [Oidiodendron maius Zn]
MIAHYYPSYSRFLPSGPDENGRDLATGRTGARAITKEQETQSRNQPNSYSSFDLFRRSDPTMSHCMSLTGYSEA